MAAPRQMTAHTLELVKGWPSQTAVDFRAKLSDNVTIDPVFAGRVVHLNSVGEYEMGLPADLCHMPIFLFENSDDPDVSNDGGDAATTAGVWVGVSSTGWMLGMPAKGAYEMESTEFDATQSYPPGTGLTATASNSNAVTGGRLTPGTKYSDSLCGVVSRGVFTNSHQQLALAFWPVWLPS